MTGTEIYPLVETAANPLAQAVGTTLADAWQAIVGDKVLAWRLKNVAALHNKLEKELAKTGCALDMGKVPERVAFAWFEKATQADEPEIQDLFAKILASAAAGNEDAMRKRNIELISSLAPDDARLLEIIAAKYVRLRQQMGNYPDRYVMTWDFSLTHKLKEEGFVDKTSIDTLLSLGILRLEREVNLDRQELIRLAGTSKLSGFNASPIEETDKLVVTSLGASLIEALYPAARDGRAPQSNPMETEAAENPAGI